MFLLKPGFLTGSCLPHLIVFSEVLEEMLAAQKDRDQALMSRLLLANEERDEALLRARRLQEAAGYDSNSSWNTDNYNAQYFFM